MAKSGTLTVTPTVGSNPAFSAGLVPVESPTYTAGGFVRAAMALSLDPLGALIILGDVREVSLYKVSQAVDGQDMYLGTEVGVYQASNTPQTAKAYSRVGYTGPAAGFVEAPASLLERIDNALVATTRTTRTMEAAISAIEDAETAARVANQLPSSDVILIWVDQFSAQLRVFRNPRSTVTDARDSWEENQLDVGALVTRVTLPLADGVAPIPPGSHFWESGGTI